jgi:ABC-type transporter Mla subunit MlaD
MAHDGNTRRDTAARPLEPSGGERTPDRPPSPSRGKPLFPVAAGQKPAAQGAAPPIPLNAPKLLPKFNTVVQAGATQAGGTDKAAFAGAPAVAAAANNAAFSAPPDIPLPNAKAKVESPTAKPAKEAPNAGTKNEGDTSRRAPKRRPAAPPRPHVVANDDTPSIGGLIFALQQRPSNQSFVLAAAGSGGWLAVGTLLAWAMLSPEIARSGFFGAVGSPTMIIVAATIFLPIALFWFLAMLAWRAQELKLMSAAMTEVAVRLAEPDRAAEQSAASLGQAVRRQVSFMNEAISRALGRAGELEGLVHNEVANLEKAYSENENKIRSLIQELAGERHALVSTTDKVSETLKSMGSDVPMLIERLSQQQVKLARIIEGAGQNLIALESQLATASGGLETTLANRTHQLQAVLDDYTVALDATLASRAEALDIQLLERTRALDDAFAERLSRFDDAMMRSTVAIDTAVSDKARALTHAMENHVRSLSDTLGQHANNLDESMMHGLDAVRRSSDNITRQSLHAIEGLSGQADMLKSVSENLVKQMAGVANQGQSIARAASALEGVISDTEGRARNVTQQLVQDATAHSQAAAAELERLRTQTDIQAQRALDDMRAKVSGVSQEVSEHLGAIASRFSDTSEDLKARAARAAAELELEQERIRAEAERLPAAARESAESMRSALSDQLRALERLSTLSNRERRDVTPPGALPQGTPLPQAAPVSLTAAFAAQRGDQNLPVPLDAADRWTLGDLLSRASREDAAINIASIARALDPTTASAIWSRFRAGQRGIMVRSIYTNDGRTLFDEISARYRTDTDFRRVVDRFLVDFEWLMRDMEQKDPAGRSVHNHLISDSGRVYLFLAHASGRLR